jgi:putative ATPase
VDTEAAREALLRFSSVLDETEGPQIAAPLSGKALPSPAETEKLFGTPVFDHIFAREPWKRGFGAGTDAATVFSSFAGEIKALLAPGGNAVILQSPPRLGERLSRVIREECGAVENPAARSVAVHSTSRLAERLAVAEETIFTAAETNQGGDWRSWDAELLRGSFEKAGFKTTLEILERKEERLITERDIEAWFDAERSSWGKAIAAVLGEGDFLKIRETLSARAKQSPLVWQWKSCLLVISHAE